MKMWLFFKKNPVSSGLLVTALLLLIYTGFFNHSSVLFINYSDALHVEPCGLNNEGEVVGWFVDKSGFDRPFFWSKKKGFVQLLAGREGRAYSINEQGYFVGMCQVSPERCIPFFGKVGDDVYYIEIEKDKSAFPIKINDRKEVIGMMSKGGERRTGFFWSRESGVIEIRTKEGFPIDVCSINNNGGVAGTIMMPSGETRSILWSKENGLVQMNFGLNSQSKDINDKGNVVGSCELYSGTWPFLWVENENILILNEFGSGGTAFSINEKMQVVGMFELSNGRKHAFFWSKNGGVVDIGKLLIGPSYADLISENGVIAGMSQASGGKRREFFWTYKSGLVASGSIKNIFNISAINDKGDVVGYVDIETPWWIVLWYSLGNLVGFSDRYLPSEEFVLKRTGTRAFFRENY